MELPVNLLTWLGAVAPVLVLLILLVYVRLSAVKAAIAAAIVAGVVAFILFEASFAVIGVASLKGVWNSLSIMAVIFPAILIYEISKEMDAFNAIQINLTRLIPDKLLQILAIGWGFSSFLQGPSGFGVPVAVTAPLLIGIGVKPLWAVAISLMAHAWANLFGTLALGWDALIQQVPLTGQVYLDTAWWSAIFTGALSVFVGFLICWQYRRGKGIAKGWIAVVVIGGIQSVGQLILTQYTPSLSVVISTTIALGAVFLLARLPRYAKIDNAPLSPIMNKVESDNSNPPAIGLHQAMLPYYLLVVLSVAVLMIEPINQFLSSWKMGFAFPETRTGYGVVDPASNFYSPIAWLSHSGFFLLLSAVIAMAYYSYKGLLKGDAIKRSIKNSWKKFIPAALSVMFLLIMSKVMSGSGLINVLAKGTANVTGDWYLFLAPFVGMLGAFMASSSVSSNILFGQFQAEMAEMTGKSSVMILSGQAGGSAIGTMVSPSKVLLASTTAGIFGQEGNIFRRLLVVAVLASLLMGIVVYFLS